MDKTRPLSAMVERGCVLLSEGSRLLLTDSSCE